jgi:hypothetical protein
VTGSDGFIRLGSLSKAALKCMRAAQLQTNKFLTLSCRWGNGHPYVQANVRKNLSPKGISVKCRQIYDLPLISVADITSQTTRYSRWQRTDAPRNLTPLQHTHRATYISPPQAMQLAPHVSTALAAQPSLRMSRCVQTRTRSVFHQIRGGGPDIHTETRLGKCGVMRGVRPVTRERGERSLRRLLRGAWTARGADVVEFET